MREIQDSFKSIMAILAIWVVAAFRDQNDEPWVTINSGGLYRNVALYSQKFSDLVLLASVTPSQDDNDPSFSLKPCGDGTVKAVRDAYRLMSDSEKRHLYLRYGGNHQGLLVDLGGVDPILIQVDGSGWGKANVESFPFFRTPDLAPLPDPDPDGDFNKLLRFLPFNDETDKIISQIYVATVPFIEYERPILVIFGPHSSGKSNVTRILRDVVDPQKEPVEDMPHDKKDLIINLSGACLPAFDNANEIVPKQCQAVFSGCVTGFTHRERRLFTNYEAARISFRRPAIVNGLVVPFSKPDLLSRCLLIKTKKIDDEKDQSDLLREFETDRPSIFGGMLNTLSQAVRILPEVESVPSDLTRFRDWARVFIAVGMALGIPREKGLQLLEKLKKRGGQYVASVVSVCESVVKLTEHPNMWKTRHKDTTSQMWVGTVSELLSELEYVAQRNRIDMSDFPKGAAQLGRDLENIAKVLGTWNITLERDEDRTGKYRDRYVRIHRELEDD